MASSSIFIVFISCFCKIIYGSLPMRRKLKAMIEVLREKLRFRRMGAILIVGNRIFLEKMGS